ncbi:GNAT family N-acetyltransferase [Carnobacterium gallinarum]|uniref:GNAT family N-acetyltransferase n=1 Tax=Carnobacterium gallinarum TaxID=2749 RepID=UPI001FE0960C|nr:GNAT family protein [Carnobacterium gallinarum]
MENKGIEQPIGFPILDWHSRELPTIQRLVGEYCYLEKIQSEKYLEDLYEVYGPASRSENWTYLPLLPFENRVDFAEYYATLIASEDPYHFAIVDKITGKAVGTMALMRIDTTNGSVEVGFVIYSDVLKRTRIATEAQYLLADYAFEKLGYRRYEWKCDGLNQPSENAALRLGFKYEGLFRQAVVYKNRNRDTKWFSIIDQEWPIVKAALVQWLATENFDETGNQLKKLTDFRK